MELINLTPHALIIYGKDENCLQLAPSGSVARVKTTTAIIDEVVVDGVRINILNAIYGEVENLPIPQPGVCYIVSRVVLNAIRSHGDERSDILVPGIFVRDEHGNVTGCEGLSIA